MVSVVAWDLFLKMEYIGDRQVGGREQLRTGKDRLPGFYVYGSGSTGAQRLLVQHHVVPEVLAGVQKVVEKQNGALIGHVLAQGDIESGEGYAVGPSTGAGTIRLPLVVIHPVLVL